MQCFVERERERVAVLLQIHFNDFNEWSKNYFQRFYAILVEKFESF